MNKTYDLSWVLEEADFDTLFNKKFTIDTTEPDTTKRNYYHLPLLAVENYKRLWVVIETKCYYTTNRPGYFDPEDPNLRNYASFLVGYDNNEKTTATVKLNETIADNKWSNLTYEMDTTPNPGHVRLQ